MALDKISADGVDQGAVGMLFLEHAPSYQRSVDIASVFSLIAPYGLLMHNPGMSFGERLRRAIKAAGYKSARQFALDGLGWDAASGPQRLQNYITKDRVPDRETLKLIAGKLGTTPAALLNEAIDAGLRDILLTLLELEGIPRDKADTLADAVLEAKRLLEVFPDDAPLQTRATHAAHAAWRQQQPATTGI